MTRVCVDSMFFLSKESISWAKTRAQKVKSCKKQKIRSHKKADFLIPDYQRPYAWQEKECQKLWDDIFEFAIPENDATKFDTNDEYFLGPIVTFMNKDKKL